MQDLDEIKSSVDYFNHQYNKTGLWVLYPFILLCIALIFFSVYGKKEIVIEGSGIVSTTDIGSSLTTNVSAKVNKILVENNEKVSKNQKLVVLDSTLKKQEVEEMKNQISQSDEKIQYIDLFKKSIDKKENLLIDDSYGYSSRFESYLNNLDIENSNSNIMLDSINKQIEINREQFKLKSSLRKDYSNFQLYINEGKTPEKINSLVVREEINQYNMNLKSNQDTINKFKSSTLIAIQEKSEITDNELLSLEESYLMLNENLRKIDNTSKTTTTTQELLSDLNMSLTETTQEKQNLLKLLEGKNKELNNYILRAPTEGTVEFTEDMINGYQITEGTEIGKVINLKEDSKFIEAYIPSSEMYEVEKGQRVIFSIRDSNKKNVDIIADIDSIKTEPVNTEEGSFYTVNCTTDKKIDALYGTAGVVKIISGETNYFNYVINQFFD